MTWIHIQIHNFHLLVEIKNNTNRENYTGYRLGKAKPDSYLHSFKNLTWLLISSWDFLPILHRNGHSLIYNTIPSKTFLKIQSTQYWKLPPHTEAFIPTELENAPKEKENHNTQNLNWYPTMLTIQTLHKNTSILLIISNNSDNKVCICKNMTIGTFEKIISSCYVIKKITITTNLNDIKSKDDWPMPNQFS